MSKHPWRTASHGFSCPPDCPKRKPGCQDHCEQHAKDKEKWAANKRKQFIEVGLDRYAAERMNRYRNKRRNRLGG